MEIWASSSDAKNHPIYVLIKIILYKFGPGFCIMMVEKWRKTNRDRHFTLILDIKKITAANVGGPFHFFSDISAFPTLDPFGWVCPKTSGKPEAVETEVYKPYCHMATRAGISESGPKRIAGHEAFGQNVINPVNVLKRQLFKRWKWNKSDKIVFKNVLSKHFWS